MDKIENKFLNRTIFDKYQIIKKEGKGAFSIVFLARNILTQKLVAVKIQELNILENEAFYLFKLKGIGIPKIYSYGYIGKYYILVQELLGKTIEKLFKENIKKGKNIRLKDMLMTGIQVIDRIKFLHFNNLLHLDIKPNNFLVGNPDDSLIYIIDFGFAKKYRSSRTGKHIKFSIKKFFNGNLKYCSVNTLRGIEPSRRDDLESIGYMLINLYNKYLPWDILKGKNIYELNKKIYNVKRLTSTELLCKGLPKEMLEFMNYIKSLQFEENPNYNYLTKLLEIMLNKINTINDLNFSWISKSCFNSKDRKSFKVFKTRRKISPFSKILERINSKSKSEEKKRYKSADTEQKEKISIEIKNQNLLINNYNLRKFNGNEIKKNNEPKIINNIPKNNKSLGKKIIQDSKSFEYDSPLYVSNNIINPKNKKFISNEKRIKKINNYRFSEIQLKNKPKSKNGNIINFWKHKIDTEQNLYNKHDNDLDVEYNFLIDYKN